MSCDWNIYCRTCDSEHGFTDANHMENEMHGLIRHAAAIAALAPLTVDVHVEFRLGYHYGAIDAPWFAAHLGHDLVPRDEYGRCADQCGENVVCECCDTRKRCTLPLKHDGAHKHQRPKTTEAG